MADDAVTGLALTLTGRPETVTALSQVNAALSPFGARIWPLDLASAPSTIRQLLQAPALEEAESRQVMDRFLLPRARLLEIVEAAGRRLQVPGGGALSTLDATHDIQYPQLYQVLPGIDYSRFDRYHVNLAEDGRGVDEVMQVLSGGGVRILQRLPDGGDLRLDIDCPDAASGWTLTYDGAYHHIGSLSRGSLGTKVLMQVFGPDRWTMQYADEG